MLRKLLIGIAAASVAALLAACNPITIKNVFGGPPLVLTGNYNADLPSITAFNASIKAGAAASAATLQSYFVAACPYVADAQSQLPAAQAAAASLMTTTAAAKQAANVATTLTAAQKLCNAGTATTSATFFSAVVDAFEWVYGMIKNGQG
jgi:hypothetical protein